MYAAVDYELVEREPRDFAPDGVECGKQYRVRRVIDYDLDSGRRLERADVPALAAYDAALDLVVVYGEGGDCVLDSRFGRRALDSVDDYSLGLLGGVETGLVHGIVDICQGLGARLGLHVFDEHLLGLLGSHPGNIFELAVDLRGEPVIFGDPGVQLVLLGIELPSLRLEVPHLAVELALLCVKLVLPGLDGTFLLAQFGVLRIHLLLVLALELQELLLGLQHLLLLDVLGLYLGLLDYRVRMSLEDVLADQYIYRNAYQSSGKYGDNIKDNHIISIYKVPHTINGIRTQACRYRYKKAVSRTFRKNPKVRFGLRSVPGFPSQRACHPRLE